MSLATSLAVPLSLHGRAAQARDAAPEPAPVNATATAESPAMDPDLARSRALYDEGRASFDTFDYEGAAKLWTKAYASLPPDADAIRNKLVYNIATAKQKAYDVDHDLTHLRQAVLLLQQYATSYEALHEPGPQTDAEVDKANQRVEAIQARIAHAERGEDETEQEPETEEPVPLDARYGSGQIDGIVWTTPTMGPPDMDKLHKNRRLANEDRKTDRILIGSYAALGVGGFFTLGGVSAVVGTRNGEQQAQRAAYSTLGLGLVGLATGFTLLAIGLERRKRARAGTLVAATPVIGRQHAGAAVSIRF
ncbi:MAG: hypothetical protein AAF799_01810 [Myxococcota bacterium]